jgi:hypothetical protein
MAIKYSVTPKSCIDVIVPVLMAGICPMITSSPGIGKSSIAAEIAKKFNLKLIDIRLSTVDPTDLTGFIAPNLETKRADYLPPSVFPLETMDKIPEGYDGWLIIFDEITSAPPAIQAAAYKVILDGMIGEHPLHPHVKVMAAGNGIKDNAVVARMSTALQSRMIHFEMECNPKEWIEYAISAGYDSRVVAYVEHVPDILLKFNPAHVDKTFPCPRTFEFLSKVISKLPAGSNASDYKWMPLYAGAVGQGAGTEFRAFLEIYKELVKFEQIELNPNNAPIPDEPSAMFAVSGMIGDRTNAANISEVMKYVQRMPIEHQVSSIKKIGAKSPELKANKAFIDWLDVNAKKLF